MHAGTRPGDPPTVPPPTGTLRGLRPGVASHPEPGGRGRRLRARYAPGVRVRVIELRILGAVLAALWVATFALILLGYRPGGPVDLVVGLSAAGPILIALAAVVWPPVARSGRVLALTAWLALGAILLLVPSIAGLVTQLEGRGPQTLLPSAEAAYPWVLALLATGLYAGIGIARQRLGQRSPRRRRLLVGSLVGLVMVLAAGSLFSTAAVVNELALGDRPAISSRFGPTDPTLEPPACDGALCAGVTAVLSLQMDSSIDGSMVGQVSVAGARSGTDIRWSGFAATRFVLGQVGYAQVGPLGWELGPSSRWSTAAASRMLGRSLDLQVLDVALTTGNRSVAENRGLAYIEGARARHCRVPLDGTTMRNALPEVELLVGDADLSRWRGNLDYWVFADGQLGQVDGQAQGPGLGLADDALLASVRFRMTIIDRGWSVNVSPPG